MTGYHRRPEWGETPVTFVVVREGATIGEDALRSRADARLGRTQRISGLRRVAAGPPSAIGKVPESERRELADRFRAEERDRRMLAACGSIDRRRGVDAR